MRSGRKERAGATGGHPAGGAKGDPQAPLSSLLLFISSLSFCVCWVLTGQGSSSSPSGYARKKKRIVREDIRSEMEV